MADELVEEKYESDEYDDEYDADFAEQFSLLGMYQVQEFPLSEEELNARERNSQQEREESANKRLRDMEEHARCALLPSPEKLDESRGSPGLDLTDTIKDFELVTNWVTEKQLLNASFRGTIEEQRQQLETCEFGALISKAFNNAFAAMRNTASLELDELVFWYYAGHGLGKEIAETLCYSSTPRLSKVGLNPSYNDAANKFVKEDRKVKGGELFLHKVGFCDLYGLLKPWIAAVKVESINAKGPKKNKHLIIVLDSCHSGIIAQELKEFQERTQEIDPSLLAENSITIQAACGTDERTLGGYFTPCFVYLNDPENGWLLEVLKKRWEKMDEQEKLKYTESDLPSPMVVTTRLQSTAESSAATMEVEVQNFKLTLFQDSGFFKFCSTEVYPHQNVTKLLFEKERVLNRASSENFMRSKEFTVLDYKLKTYQTDFFAGTPMGLFLLKDPANPGFAVCAHIHFKRGNTRRHEKIKLVHHKKPPMGSTLFVEDHDGLPDDQIDRGQHKIPVSLDKYANHLVQACRKYVESTEPGRWQDATRWNMAGPQLGVNGKFRLKERSAWEDSYLKYINKFDFPNVADTLLSMNN